MRFLTALTLISAAAFLGVQPATADDYEVGQAALERGDYAAARQVWTKHAQAGDPRAQLALGRLLIHEADPQGLDLIRKSAQAGYLPAEMQMARYHLRGKYVPLDLDAFVTWLRRAAAHSVEERAKHPYASAKCQHLLGLTYYHGLGAPKDVARATALMRQAADRGLPGGQLLYAQALEKGEGVARDLVEAYKYYLLCYKQDVDQESLERAKAIRKRLTVEQLEDVKDRLRTWVTAWKAGTLGQIYRRWKSLPEGAKAIERMQTIRNYALTDARSFAQAMDPDCLHYWLQSRERIHHDAARETTAERWILGCGATKRVVKVTFTPYGVTRGEKEVKWVVQGSFPIGRP